MYNSNHSRGKSNKQMKANIFKTYQKVVTIFWEEKQTITTIISCKIGLLLPALVRI